MTPLAFFLPNVFGVILMVVGALVCGSLYLIGGIGMIAVPFQESILCGLLNLFLPFYSLFYLVTRWDAMKRWFLSSLAGGMIVVVFAILVPAVVAARGAADNALRRQQGQVAGIPGPNGQARPGGGGVEQELVAQIELIESLADLLQTVNDEDKARQVGPQFREMRDRLVRNDPRIQQLNRDAGVLERLSVDVQYTARAKAATERFKAQMQRVQSLPAIFAALSTEDRGRPRLDNPARQPRLARNARPAPNLPGAVDPPPDVEAEAEAVPPARAEALAAPRQPAMPDPRPDVSKSLDDLIADLKIPDNQPRKRALEILMRTPVDPDRREEVARAIADILRDPDHFTRNDAAKTFAYWGARRALRPSSPP